MLLFNTCVYSKPGVSKLQPMSQIWPTKLFHPASKTFVNNGKIIYLQKNFIGIMQHIQKISHHVRHLALKLLYISSCGPQRKKFGTPALDCLLLRPYS